MKNIRISEFLAGISAASTLVGLALLGLTLGNSLSTGIPMPDQMLFLPANVCMGAGVLNIMLIILSDSSLPKNENS